MDVTIIGGGITGLALAHELAPDHHVTVLETSPGPRGGGYMIDFFGPGFLAAERMGIIEELRARGHAFEGVRYGTPDGKESGRLDVGPLVEAAGGRYFSILRPEVELGLLAVLPSSVDLRYATRVVAIRDPALEGATAGPGRVDDRVRAVRSGSSASGTSASGPSASGSSASRRPAVELADGRVIESDLIVACDGVRSVARELVAPGHGPIVPMGYRVASYLYDDPELAAELGERMLMTDTVGRVGWAYAADETRVGVMLSERVRAAGTARPTPDRERLQREFAGLHPQVDRALTHAPESFYDDLVAQAIAPQWSRGRVVLAGDAAHAPSLLAGQGTSVAIAGAEALARSLRATGPHIEAGLAEYERRWRPTAETVQRSGRRSASFFIPAGPFQLRLQQIGRRTVGLPGVSRLVTRSFIAA